MPKPLFQELWDASDAKHQRVIRGVDLVLTHPEDISEEMTRLIRNWQRKSGRAPIREIARFHVEFELIHPFGDGNGRVGRLLLTFQCLEHDYVPVVVENDRKAEYYDTLEYAQRESEGPFVRFIVEEMERTHRLLVKYL